MKRIFLVAALAVISTAAFAQKFAHVNSQECMQLMPEMDEVRTQMDAIVKENQEVMKSMYDEYQTKVQTYQQKVATWTDAIKQSKEKEIVDMESRLQETQQNMQQEMQAIQNKLTAPVMQKFQDTLDKVAKEGNYIFVFDAGSALYVDPAQSTDLTPILRKALGIKEGRTLEALYTELQAKQAAAQN